MIEVIERLDIIIDNLDSKWRGKRYWKVYSSEKLESELYDIYLDLINEECMKECMKESITCALSTLAKSVVNPKNYIQASSSGKYGIYPNGIACSRMDRIGDDYDYSSICNFFESINRIKGLENVGVPTQYQTKVVPSNPVELYEIEPTEGQRAITDNAVWWITKAMQKNKSIDIADTKTCEGLMTILNKNSNKLYEKRSLSQTRTEIRSLKEFLQQLIDAIPEPES